MPEIPAEKPGEKPGEVRRAATIRGVVQGVSFRWYTRQEAERLGLVGWVRNEPDGRVRLEVQGPEHDVEELLTWVGHGPTHARVVDVAVSDLEPTEVDIDFSITH